ncbi:TatD DNase family protein [Desulfacinum infernum DSM 9756]|uniref:TatD DNase family protein n=1 Tax=Desulfacinum infernum DSM 9756 TaxID=1121391 RepID=A0A1M5BXN2_9BACT|nr:TatD family hydrolase [Desulfacinum infernum]SHF47181.1 TatD DNase family protein [Desulfacinum infernum DSM 9756]
MDAKKGMDEVLLVDTHAHLDFPELIQDLKGVFRRCAQAGVDRIVTVGIDRASSQKAVSLSGEYPFVFATVGLHPHGARELGERDLEEMAALARNPKVVALGEMGLDYFRDRQPRPVQRRCFGQQLELAAEMKLPAVFHIRDAFEDFFREVMPWVPKLVPSVLHCFSGDWPVAKKALDLGFYLSIPGTVTYKNAVAQQEVVQKAPLERLLVETDAPFLTPVPFRGKPNEPALVRYTAHRIAELRGCPLETVARATTRNAYKVLGLEQRAG